MANPTQHATPRTQAALRPPAAQAGMLGWLRTNLFSSWFSSLLTVLAVLLLAKIIPPLVHWFVVNAVWTATDPAACKEASGACWAMIHEKYRLILFGRYPYEQQWRPLLGILVLVAMIGVSCNRKFWRPWLADVWIGGLAVWFLLMWGGMFGLSFVPNNLWAGCRSPSFSP